MTIPGGAQTALCPCGGKWAAARPDSLPPTESVVTLDRGAKGRLPTVNRSKQVLGCCATAICVFIGPPAIAALTGVQEVWVPVVGAVVIAVTVGVVVEKYAIRRR